MNPSTVLKRLITERVEAAIAVKRAFLQDETCLTVVEEVANVLTKSLRTGGTIFFFGNGGSAADAQHLAAELAGRYLRERPGLAGLALTTNSSCVTAIGNDYGYDLVFARQLRAIGSPGDVAIALSTSGNSASVLRAVEAAREEKLISVGLTGAGGGLLKPLVDYCICIPSEHPARIQEMHILAGHILCEIIEEELFNEGGIS
jgi:D-sedoheptulose 7-phosphate isomerase